MRHAHRSRHSRVNIRHTHPALWRLVTTCGLSEIMLGLGFWFSTPTFDPYDIPYTLVSVVFLTLGLAQLAFLNLWRDLPWLRIMQAVSVTVTFAWGVINTQQVIAGKASWQLPILLLTVCALQIPLVIEPPVNPMTEKS